MEKKFKWKVWTPITFSALISGHGTGNESLGKFGRGKFEKKVWMESLDTHHILPGTKVWESLDTHHIL